MFVKAKKLRTKSKYDFGNTFQTLDTNDVRTWQFYPSDSVPSTGYVYPDGEAQEKQPPGVNKVQYLLRAFETVLKKLKYWK